MVFGSVEVVPIELQAISSEAEKEFGMLDQWKDQQWDVGRYEV